jgi:hypothetical protein
MALGAELVDLPELSIGGGGGGEVQGGSGSRVQAVTVGEGSSGRLLRQRGSPSSAACSFGWWLMAGAGLF